MAGGMHRGYAGPSLADRAASSGVQQRPPDGEQEREPVGSSSEPPPPKRFVPPPPPAGRAARPPEPDGATAHRPGPDAPAAPRPETARPAGRTVAPGHGRHCWVRDPPDAPGIWPGLLVEWRQREDGWHGRVAYAVPGAYGPVLVEAWLPAERLKQG